MTMTNTNTTTGTNTTTTTNTVAWDGRTEAMLACLIPAGAVVAANGRTGPFAVHLGRVLALLSPEERIALAPALQEVKDDRGRLYRVRPTEWEHAPLEVADDREETILAAVRAVLAARAQRAAEKAARIESLAASAAEAPLAEIAILRPMAPAWHPEARVRFGSSLAELHSLAPQHPVAVARLREIAAGIEADREEARARMDAALAAGAAGPTMPVLASVKGGTEYSVGFIYGAHPDDVRPRAAAFREALAAWEAADRAERAAAEEREERAAAEAEAARREALASWLSARRGTGWDAAILVEEAGFDPTAEVDAILLRRVEAALGREGIELLREEVEDLEPRRAPRAVAVQVAAEVREALAAISADLPPGAEISVSAPQRATFGGGGKATVVVVEIILCGGAEREFVVNAETPPLRA